MINEAQIKLTEIEIIPIKPINGLLGFASFVIDSKFYVGNIGIHSTANGNIRLLYPDKRLPNGKIISSFHPITKHAGIEITKQITCKYNNILASLAHKPIKRGCVHEL